MQIVYNLHEILNPVFWGTNKKNIINFSYAESAQRVVKVKEISTNEFILNHPSAYCNNPKFWDRYDWLITEAKMRYVIRVYTVCHTSDSF